MIKEAYVSFETALLLKEKRFDEECRGFFHTAFEDPHLSTWNGDHKNSDYEECVSAPTQQMAMAWLRKKGLFIQIGVVGHSTITMPEKYYFFRIYENRRYISHNRTETYYTYEEAVEAALKYCLEEVI